ncbi:MAG: DUF3006 domain-containing protein [Oscillospiraceae bacterium]|nr:DUF3006 domain-containing protein [Oscillospiraceae bacterium]
MFYVFERIEGEFAVLVSDEKNSINVLKDKLQGKIGDVFTKDEDGNFILKQDETERRHAEIVSRHRALFNKSK